MTEEIDMTERQNIQQDVLKKLNRGAIVEKETKKLYDLKQIQGKSFINKIAGEIIERIGNENRNIIDSTITWDKYLRSSITPPKNQGEEYRLIDTMDNTIITVNKDQVELYNVLNQVYNEINGTVNNIRKFIGNGEYNDSIKQESEAKFKTIVDNYYKFLETENLPSNIELLADNVIENIHTFKKDGDKLVGIISDEQTKTEKEISISSTGEYAQLYIPLSNAMNAVNMSDLVLSDVILPVISNLPIYQDPKSLSGSSITNKGSNPIKTKEADVPNIKSTPIGEPIDSIQALDDKSKGNDNDQNIRENDEIITEIGLTIRQLKDMNKLSDQEWENIKDNMYPILDLKNLDYGYKLDIIKSKKLNLTTKQKSIYLDYANKNRNDTFLQKMKDKGINVLYISLGSPVVARWRKVTSWFTGKKLASLPIPVANKIPFMKQDKAIEENRRKNEQAAEERAAKEAAEKERAAKEQVEQEQPVVEQVEQEQPVVEQVEQEQPAVEQVEQEQPAVEQVEQEQPVVEQVEQEQPVVEQVEQEQPAVEQVEHEQPVVEQVEQEQPVVGQPKIDNTPIVPNMSELQSKSKEELIEMIQNGAILANLSSEDLEKLAQERRGIEIKENYLQKQRENEERFKKRYLLEYAKSTLADKPEELENYLNENNISPIEWQMGKPLSQSELEQIKAEQEQIKIEQETFQKNRQDLIDYASSYSGIDRYALLQGVPGFEKNQYGVTDSDVENYIQSKNELQLDEQNDISSTYNGRTK